MKITRATIKSLLLNIAILLAVYFAVHLYQTRNTPTGSVPELSGLMLDGEMIKGLTAFEKPILVHYWATWCKVCQFEHDNISRIAEDYPVIGVASQSGSLAEVKSYVESQGIAYPVLLDNNGYNAEKWGITGYPTSFIVGKNNKILFSEVGFTSEFGVRLRLWLATQFP